MYDPAQERKVAHDFTLRFFRTKAFDPSRPMGNVGSSDVNMMVPAIVAGMWDEVREEIPRRLEWIEYALDRNEKFGESENFHRSNLLQAKGIGLWLLRNDPATEVWSQAYDHFVLACKEPNVWAPKHQATLALDDQMMLACLSGRWADGVAAYREKVPGADPLPKSAKQPRQVGQLICLQAGRSVDPMAADAAHRMLRSKLADEWLGRGQGLRAAMWLKIVWGYLGCDKPPHEVLLLAYEDMPEVVKPADIA